MDEKTLMAICNQLAHIQLQIDGLLGLFLLHHPQEETLEQYRRLLDEGYKNEGHGIVPAIRDRIRNGIVIQDLMELGLGHLWGPGENPPDSHDQPR